jgi:hypothetical protein
MNINIPPLECYVRAEYLYDFKDKHGELIECTAFAVKSLQSNALLFYVMTDIGAVYDKIPISALVPYSNSKSEHLSYDILQLWDCLSYKIEAVEFMFLKGKRCKVLLKNKDTKEGIYRFTLDWSGDSSDVISTSYAEITQEHKVAHIIELFDGYYCAYPNNRILWAEPSSVENPFVNIPDYKLNYNKYHCESKDKWAVKNTDKQFY